MHFHIANRLFFLSSSPSTIIVALPLTDILVRSLAPKETFTIDRGTLQPLFSSYRMFSAAVYLKFHISFLAYRLSFLFKIHIHLSKYLPLPSIDSGEIDRGLPGLQLLSITLKVFA